MRCLYQLQRIPYRVCSMKDYKEDIADRVKKAKRGSVQWINPGGHMVRSLP